MSSHVNATLVVGQILSHQPHEKRVHIKICKVDIGLEIKTIVCGGPNVADGLKVVVALPGHQMLDYKGSGEVAYTVEARKTYGVVSEAVMCAPEEIGIKETDEGKRASIVVVPARFQVGEPLKPEDLT